MSIIYPSKHNVTCNVHVSCNFLLNNVTVIQHVCYTKYVYMDKSLRFQLTDSKRILPTVLNVFVPQGIRRCSAGASVPRCGDGARIREVIANTSRYLILRDS